MGKHEKIADSLARDILVGQYRIGDRLPSERDLAARFTTNRGAVREAMKKLEQLGIVDIQAGGARVTPVEQASLDIISHLLAVDEVPDYRLVEQIMTVMDTLVGMAAETAIAEASDQELERLRRHIKPLFEETLDREAHFMAQGALMGAIMDAAGNLVCRLIARALLLQFAPPIKPLKEYLEFDTDAYTLYAKQLDRALGNRDGEATRAILGALSALNRDSMANAFAAYEQAQNQAVPGVAGS